MLKTQVTNSKGNHIILNDAEEKQVNFNQKQINNSTGYEIDVTTLTAISKRIVEQKFFTLAPADYMPLRVGENPWAADILTYRDFSLSGGFEEGIINTASSGARLAQADGGVDSVTVPVISWAKGIEWSLPQLQQAKLAGNWDIVVSKERARKKDWDLGIQKIAFLGSDSNTAVQGLLTQGDVTANTAVITKTISSMTTSEFDGFLRAIINAYRVNSAYTSMPTHFVMPEADYQGLISYPDSTYSLKTKLEILTDNFKLITQNPNFKILPCAYADKANNAAVVGLNKNRYSLYNYDEDSARMDIPVDYTNTLQNTVNGFQFQNVGYGQFTGFKAYRPKEMLYFDWS